MSSTKSTCVNEILFPKEMPLKIPLILADKRALLNPSVTTRKNKGASGHPYLSPRPELKNLEATPLIGIEKETEVKLLITQVIKGTPKPILLKITRR